MPTTTPVQTFDIPAQMLASIQAARRSLVFLKASIRVGDPRTVGARNQDVRDLEISFLDHPQSLAEAKNVWTSLKHTLWGEEARTKGDYLARFADEKSRLTGLVAFDIKDIAADRPYTNRAGEEVTPYKLKWLQIFNDEFLMTLGKRSEEEGEEDVASSFMEADGSEEV